MITKSLDDTPHAHASKKEMRNKLLSSKSLMLLHFNKVALFQIAKTKAKTSL
uniref:Uncharacterized protein n=1 Tax=Escherichia coli TaxID=562 RepID=A0A7L8KBY9_ECOLX|nr:hypothetical protein [Escherichia coli]UCK65654.1 hypothetical protein [Providencia rettgeri]